MHKEYLLQDMGGEGTYWGAKKGNKDEKERDQ